MTYDEMMADLRAAGHLKPTLTTAQMKKPLTGAHIGPLIAALAPVIRDYVASQVQPLREKIAQLEARPALEYRGVWKSGEPYKAGSAVTDQGGLWIAKVATSARPGSSSDWQLCVKSGEVGGRR